MKKVLLAVLAGALCLPAFAKDVKCDGDKCPMMKKGRMEMAEHHKKGKKDGRADAFKKARKEHKAKMKATEDKMEKLVEEYNKMKPGKKKDAKKAEIAALVSDIRDEQIKFKEEQLKRFSERLEKMKKGLEAQKSGDAKKAWVEQKTDEVIADDGDLDALFESERPGMIGPGHHEMGPRMGPMTGEDLTISSASESN